MFQAHQHRLRALEMLLRSMRTCDPALQSHFGRLSELWLALAERRDQLGNLGDGPAPAVGGIWKPISGAPRHEELRVLATAWGPRIWLRGGSRTVQARWRSEATLETTSPQPGTMRPARWEDLDGAPLAFTPTEWRELDD